MDRETLDLLKSCDDPEHCEYPSDFNWFQAMARVENLKPELEGFLQRSLSMDKNVQDASFFTQLSIIEECFDGSGKRILHTAFGIRFSCFGNLFTVWHSLSPSQMSDDRLSKIISTIEAHDFVYVDEDSLNEPYSGNNKYLSNIASWWLRYFDYL